MFWSKIWLLLDAGGVACVFAQAHVVASGLGLDAEVVLTPSYVEISILAPA